MGRLLSCLVAAGRIAARISRHGSRIRIDGPAIPPEHGFPILVKLAAAFSGLYWIGARAIARASPGTTHVRATGDEDQARGFGEGTEGGGAAEGPGRGSPGHGAEDGGLPQGRGPRRKRPRTRAAGKSRRALLEDRAGREGGIRFPGKGYGETEGAAEAVARDERSQSRTGRSPHAEAPGVDRLGRRSERASRGDHRRAGDDRGGPADAPRPLADAPRLDPAGGRDRPPRTTPVRPAPRRRLLGHDDRPADQRRLSGLQCARSQWHGRLRGLLRRGSGACRKGRGARGEGRGGADGGTGRDHRLPGSGRKRGD